MRRLRPGPASFPHDATVLETALSAARMGIWECSLPDGRLTWTRGVFDLFDLAHDASPDRPTILTCYADDVRSSLEALRESAIREGTGFETDVPITSLSGQSRWIRITGRVERRDGRPVRIFGTKRDITQEHALLERTRFLAEHDMLTGLANRSGFYARLEAVASRRDGDATLLLVDLDGFKAVNDGHGHGCGDAVLVEAAGRLSRAGGPLGFAGRLGGDEFALLLEGPRPDCEAVAWRIVADLARPIVTAAATVSIGASVGMAERKEATAPDAWVERADKALYRAKAAGRGTVAVDG